MAHGRVGMRIRSGIEMTVYKIGVLEEIGMRSSHTKFAKGYSNRDIGGSPIVSFPSFVWPRGENEKGRS